MIATIRKQLVRLSRACFGWPPAPGETGRKHAIIRHFAAARPKPTLVETGTFKGDTIAAVQGLFVAVKSIELSPELHAAAAERFKQFSHIQILQGDSAKMLKVALQDVHGPVVYWLDGHFSGEGTARGDQDCPVLAELEIITRRNNAADVILIDDARLFGARKSYPSIKRLTEIIKAVWPTHKVEVADDIISIYQG